MAENEATDDTPPLKLNWPEFSTAKLTKYLSIIILACTAGYIQYKYVSVLFENDRNFSHLSEIEREMSLQSELGFYYSYYKTVAYERQFMLGITKLIYDRWVEYPNEVNAFSRFNIYPEVLIAGLYRYFEPALNTTAHRECHRVSRGEGLSPVKSCVGLGEPIMFYLEAVWVLQGVYIAVVFLHATTLSNSLLGGMLTILHYFTNHVECTRVQWSPNQRENMAAPFLALQIWLVSVQLRDRDRRTQLPLQISIFILNCICFLFWQFTQFIFLTQLFIYFVMEQLRIIDLKTLCLLLHSHFCGLHMAVLILQGNDMLKSSLYTSFFAVLSVYCLFFSSFRLKVKTRKDLMIESLLVVLRIVVVLVLSVYLKKGISDFMGYEEDSHVWEILYSKLTSFKSFHTLLYTCSAVFDFLPLSSVWNLISSCLVPYVVFGVINVVRTWYVDASFGHRQDKKTEKKQDDSDSSSGEDSDIDEAKQDLNSLNKQLKAKGKDDLMRFLRNLDIDPEVFYNIAQMVVYGVMAGLVMRLKMLFVPQMCVVASLVMNKRYYKLPKKYMKYLPYFWFMCLLPVLYTLLMNVDEEMSHIGEYSDPQKERLMMWIRKQGNKAVFAGSMPLMATVLLVGRKAVVTHPHYEHKEARQRAYSVYKMYGYFTAQELYLELTKLRATHLIVETNYCYGRSSLGCSYSDIWSAERAPRASVPSPLCRELLRGRTDHLFPVYRDANYAVFKVHDLSVSYMPRSFDT